VVVVVALKSQSKAIIAVGKEILPQLKGVISKRENQKTGV
jgi:hypothetical protein